MIVLELIMLNKTLEIETDEGFNVTLKSILPGQPRTFVIKQKSHLNIEIAPYLKKT